MSNTQVNLYTTPKGYNGFHEEYNQHWGEIITIGEDQYYATVHATLHEDLTLDQKMGCSPKSYRIISAYPIEVNSSITINWYLVVAFIIVILFCIFI